MPGYPVLLRTNPIARGMPVSISVALVQAMGDKAELSRGLLRQRRNRHVAGQASRDDIGQCHPNHAQVRKP